MLEITYESDIGEKLQGLATEFRAARAELLRKAGGQLDQALRNRIESSGLGYINGKIRSWQVQKLGTGYVAVHPDPEAYQMTQTGKKYSAGYITNSLESGHKVRFPSGKSQRYRPEVHVARARAFKFYAATRPDVEKVERETAEAMEQRLTAYLEG